MKANRIFSVLAGVLTLASCSQYEPFQVPGGIDSSKPSVSSFSYNEGISGDKAAGFDWDAASAVKAGAVSFTIELTTNTDEKNVKNGTFIKIVKTEKDVTSYSASVTGSNSNGTLSLAKGSYYYARIRANYDGYVFSDWKTLDGCVLVGTGIVSAEFTAPKDLAVTSTDASIALTWTPVPFAVFYSVEYKASSDSEWGTVAASETKTSFEIEGLAPETSYDVRVCAYKDDKNHSDYTTATISTKEPSKFNPAMSNVNQLLEFFKTEAAAASSTSEFSLEADMDLGGITLPEIAQFKGTLDGKNHVIKNWKSSGDALINTLSGTVRNLVLDSSCSLDMAINGDGPEGGLVVATIAKFSTGTVENCTSKASVTVNVGGIANSPVIAGLVGFQNGGTFKGNTNEGNISLTHAGTANVEVDGLTRKPFSAIGGVLALADKATIENCTNTGKVDVTTTKNSAVTARHYIGGILGTPYGCDIKGCVNKGDVVANFGEGGTTTTSAGKQVYIAGIAGGRNGDVKDLDGANIDNCQNYGNITIDIDFAANHYLSGITGQAHAEAASGLTGSETYGTRKITNCTNYGTLTKKGASQCRIGGISAGAATIDGCTNAGDIIIENIAAAGAVGGLVGYPTQPAHTVNNSKNTGKMVSKVDVAFAMGGLFGQGGNTVQSYEGCSVDCTMEAPANVLCGLILGTAKTLGSGKSITYGTAANPFKVKGSVRGTKLDSSNMASLIIGDGGKTAGGTIDVANVQIAN